MRLRVTVVTKKDNENAASSVFMDENFAMIDGARDEKNETK